MSLYHLDSIQSTTAAADDDDSGDVLAASSSSKIHRQWQHAASSIAHQGRIRKLNFLTV